MTLENNPAKIFYDGNGATVDFAFEFKYLADSEIEVYVDDALVNSDDYTITPAPSGVDGGTITLDTAAPSGTDNVLIQRVVPYTQPDSVPTVDKLGRGLLETMFDRVSMQVQQLAEITDRCLKIAFDQNVTPDTEITLTAGKAVIVNDDGDGFTLSAEDYEEQATASAASAAAALVSQNAAAASAAAALVSETNAASSASTATTQATNASNSASSASTSASTATTQATNASNSASAASTSASNAATSETNASNSASSASTSASTATTQATNASNSASTASTQATNASNSASAAATSASNASTSATNAATSETNAAASAAMVNLRTIRTITGADTVIASDRNKLLDYTSTGHTLAFTAAATLGSGFEFHVRHSGSGNLVLDPNGGELIDGAATVTLTAGQAVVVVCTGTAFKITQAKGYGAGAGTLTSVGAGTGISTGGAAITGAGTVSLDLNSLSTVTIASGDYVSIVDVSDSNNLKKALVSDILALGTMGLVTKTSVSGAASVTMTVPAAGEAIEGHVTGTVATDAVNLNAQIAVASVYQSGASDYAWRAEARDMTTTGTSRATGDDAHTAIQLNGSATIGNAAGERFDFEWTLLEPLDTTHHKMLTWNGGYLDTATTRVSSNGSGYYRGGNSAISNLRFIPSSGNLTATLYAVVKRNQ